MGNIGAGELVLIFFVALIVLGPTKLPEAARQVAQVLGELRRMSQSFQQELQDAIDQATPPSGPVVSELPTNASDQPPTTDESSAPHAEGDDSS